MNDQPKPTSGTRKSQPSNIRDDSRVRRKWKLLVGLGVLVVVLGGVALAGVIVAKKARARAALADNLEKGYVLLEEGRPDEARQLIGPYVQVNPKDVEAKYAYAQANRQVEQPNGQHLIETIGFLRQILDTDPNHAEAERDLVDLSTQLGLFAEVLKMTANVPADPGEEPVFLRARSIALLNSGDFDTALEYAKAFNEAEPNDVAGHIHTLQILHADRAGADVLRERAEQVIADMSPARQALVRGYAEGLIGNHERAIELARSAADSSDNDPEFVTPLVTLLDNYGQFDQALSVLESASQVQDVNAKLRFAQRLWEGGQYEELLRRTDELEPSDPTVDPRLLGLRGFGLIATGRRAEVADIIDGLNARPEQTSARAWAAVLEVWPDGSGIYPLPTERVADALAAAKSALQITQHGSFEYLLGVALVRSGEPIAGADHLYNAVRLAPTWRAPAVEHLRTLLGSGRGQEAVTAARVLLQRGRTDPETLAVVAEAIARLSGASSDKGVDDALKLIEDALAIDANAVDARILKANLLKERGDVEGATALLGPMLADPALFTDAPRAALRAVQLGRQMELDVSALLDDLTWRDADERVAFARERAVGTESVAAAESAMNLEGATPAEELALLDARLVLGSDRASVGAAVGTLAEKYPQRVDVQQRAAVSAATIPQRRAAVARLEALVEPHGLNWPTTAAVLVLQQADERGQPLPEKELAELALKVSAVTRSYEEALEPRLVLAEILTRLGSRPEAIEQVARAVESAPQNVPILLKLSEMYQQDGMFAQAEPHLRTLEQLASRPSTRMTPDERRTVGRLLADAGQSARAVAVLEGLPRTDELPDLQLLQLYRNQGTIDPTLAASLLESGDTQQLLFVADYFASRGEQNNLDAALDRLAQRELPPGQLERVRGDAAARSGDFAGAIGHYRAAVQVTPKEREIWRRLVLVTLSNDDPASAVAIANEAAGELDNGAAFATFARNLGKVAQAQNLLRDIPQMRDLLATLLVEESDNEPVGRAVDLVIAARASDENLAEVAQKMAVIAREAPRLYELQDLTTRLALLSGQWELAYESAERSARFDQVRVEPARFAAEAKANAGDWSAAVDLAERWEQRSRAAGADPTPAILLQARGHLAQNQASRTLAMLRDYRRQMAEDPAGFAEMIAVYSDALFQRNSGSEAIPLLEPLLEDHSFARQFYVRILGSQWADPQVAAEKLEAVTPAIESAGPGEMIVLARAWNELKARGHANENFDTLIQSAAKQMIEQDLPLRDGVYVETAMLGSDLLNREQLIALYEKALAANPDNPLALNNLAMQLIAQGDSASLDAALGHAQKVAALSDHPAHAYFLDTFATVQRARGELSEAARSLYDATQADPQNPRWYANLAEVQLELKSTDAARANWLEAKRLAEGRRGLEPETAEALARLEKALQ